MKKYIEVKIKELFSDFQYEVVIDMKYSQASDGNGDINKANNSPLELQITFNNRNTGNPVTDADFKDGFILKVEANAKWISTPKITAQEVQEALNKLGSVNITGNNGTVFTAEFGALTVGENQNQYTAELSIDTKNQTVDLITFKEMIEKELSKSQTKLLVISSIAADESAENSFIFYLQEVSADKIVKGNLVLTVTLTGGGDFTERELSIDITSIPEIVTDNKEEPKKANFNLNTDAETVSFDVNSVTAKGNSIQINKDDVTVSYDNKTASITLSAKAVSEAHTALSSGSTAVFELDLTAKSAGYKDKAGIKMTLHIKKGDTLPTISVDDFNNWLNNINVNGFDKSVSSASLSLTASADITADTALNNIKESLKQLPKEKILLEDIAIDHLYWENNAVPTGNNNGTIKVEIKFADGYALSDELSTILSQNGSIKFTITVNPKSSWISVISVDDFNNWLNNINVSGFDKSVSSASLTLTATSDVTTDTALNNIKESLKQLPKAPISASSIDYLKWDSYEYPISDRSGVIMVSVNFAQGYSISDELKGYLSQNGFYKLRITVKPKSKWVANISIEGDGANADYPLNVYLGDGKTDPAEVPYTIKLPEGATISSITISELKQAEGIADDWNIINKNLKIFEDNITSPSLRMIDYEVAYILQDIDIPRDSFQICKVALSVQYNSGSTSISESIDLYVRLQKDYTLVTKEGLTKALIQGLSGQKIVNSGTPVNININDNVVLNIAGGTFELPNRFIVIENALGAGKISYINNSIDKTIMEKELTKAGINFNSVSLNFTKKQGDSKIATVDIQVSKRNGYIFDQDSLGVFNPSIITIELYTPNQDWLD